MTRFTWRVKNVGLAAFVLVSIAAAIGVPLTLLGLEEMVSTMKQEHIETAQKYTAAIYALEAGRIAPAGSDVIGVLKSSLKSDESAQGVVAALWAMNWKAARVVAALGFMNIVICIALYRERRRKHVHSNAP
jgi:hypothetical protein